MPISRVVRPDSERLRLQPLTVDAGTLLAIDRPRLRETVVHDIVALDAERVLNDRRALDS